MTQKASYALQDLKIKLASLKIPTQSSFDKEQLQIGTKIELEHTNDKKIAEQIAKHHLQEFPNYYEELPKFEKMLSMSKEASITPPNTRYLTASLDADYVPNPEKQGKFASYFLLKGDEINGREWGVTSSSIPSNISSFIGRPLVATGNKFVQDSPYGVDFVHPSIGHFIRRSPELVAGLNPMNMNDILSFQERFRIGTIDDVYFDSTKRIWNASVKLAEGVEASALPPFCSPALYQLDMTEPEGNITQWTGLHLAALTTQPAYGSMALLNGTCSGTSGQCKTQFAGNSNSLTTDVMRIAAQLSTENRNVDKVVLAKRKNKNY